MLEILVLMGLTYTCVQTLFFLNCLNSRRREQRRLERAYRDSFRKLKGGGGAVNPTSGDGEGSHSEGDKGLRVLGRRSQRENGKTKKKEGSESLRMEGRRSQRVDVRIKKIARSFMSRGLQESRHFVDRESEQETREEIKEISEHFDKQEDTKENKHKQTGEDDYQDMRVIRENYEVAEGFGGENDNDQDKLRLAAENCEGAGLLVTRVVVRSGKPSPPTSHQTQTAIVRVEAEHDLARLTRRDWGDHQDGRRCAVEGVRAGCQHFASAGTVCNITVNSNMIEVRGDSHIPPVEEDIYESIEGEPISLLTQATSVGEDFHQDTLRDPTKENTKKSRHQRKNSDEHSTGEEKYTVSEDNEYMNILAWNDEEAPEMLKDVEGTSQKTQISYCNSFDERQSANDHNATGESERREERQEQLEEDTQVRKESRSDDNEGRADEDECCLMEEDLAPPRPPGPVNLISTIDQILHSPPESLEPGLILPHIADLSVSEVNETADCEIGASGSENGDIFTDVDTVDCGKTLPSWDVQYPEQLHNSDIKDMNNDRTWTLPRSRRHIPHLARSLPRQRSRVTVVKEEKEVVLHCHTLPHLTASHSSRRDGVLRSCGSVEPAAPADHQSTPVMVGATTLPLRQGHPGAATLPRQGYPVDASRSHSGPATLPRRQRHQRNTSISQTTPREFLVLSHNTSNHKYDSGEAGSSTEALSSDNSKHGESDDSLCDPSDSQETGNQNIVKETLPEFKPTSKPDDTMSSEEVDEVLPASCNVYEDVGGGEDEESVGWDSQCEAASESDTHADSGYESPVKADVHSSDDAVSTSSSSSSHDHHYEDIDPALLLAEGGGGRARMSSSSSRRSHKPKDTGRRDDTNHDPITPEEARRRQRLQGLDDLIAGVPPPDYDDLTPGTLDDGSARPDVDTSTTHAHTTVPPPPPEFEDLSGNHESGASRRPLQSTMSVPLNPGTPKARPPLSRSQSHPPAPPPLPAPSSQRTGDTDSAARHSPASSKSPSPRSVHSSLEEEEDHEEEEEEDTRSFDFMRRDSQRSDNSSIRSHRKVDRPMSLPLDVAEHYGQVLENGRDRSATLSHQDLAVPVPPSPPRQQAPKTLPFIPPKFPPQPSDSGLIKPSEYLRSLGEASGCSNGGGCGSPSGSPSVSTRTRQINSPAQVSEAPSVSVDTVDSSSNSNSSNGQTHNGIPHPPIPSSTLPLPSIPEATEEEQQQKQQQQLQQEPSINSTGSTPPPPPPPAPPAPPMMPMNRANTLPNTSSPSNTLSANSKPASSSNTLNGKTGLPSISVTDLQSVQLRRTEIKSLKPTSGPLRLPLTPEPSLSAVKNDVIAELKMGVDIPGIKKLKSERAKEEEKSSKIEKAELSKHFSASNFVDHVPDTDTAGNRIPDWKRQMLARKAAERAKKEAQESRELEAEERRQQSIPPWKRQLMMRHNDDGKRGSMYVPRVEDVKKIKVVGAPQDLEKENTKPSSHEDSRGDKAPSTTSTTPSNTSTTPSTPSNTQSAPSNTQSVPPKTSSSTPSKQSDPPTTPPPMPWRTNLRKTNSRLSLVE